MAQKQQMIRSENVALNGIIRQSHVEMVRPRRHMSII